MTEHGLPTVAALGVGLVGLIAGGIVLLNTSDTRRAGLNTVTGNHELVGSTGAPQRLCQGGELLPKDTSAIQVSLEVDDSSRGPRVAVTATAAGRVLTHGTRAAGWSGQQVTIPVRHVTHTAAGVRICVQLGRGAPVTPLGDVVSLDGTGPRAASLDNSSITGRIRITYLRSGHESWWSYAPTVAHRLGLARAWTGLWVAVLAGVLMIAAAALAVARLLRDQATNGSRFLPPAAWVCALVAFLNATAWSLITPSMQVPDEGVHFAYTQSIAEQHRAPAKATGNEAGYSPEQTIAADRLRWLPITFQAHIGIWSELQQRQVNAALAARPSRRGSNLGGPIRLEPPLYYILAAVPYRADESGTLLDRLAIMRLFSALLGAITTLCVFLFVRETLPGTPWAWTVGGLGFALQPLFGFMAGGVTPDAMHYLCSALLFYLLARAFRRGLTPRLSIAIGVVIAAGVLSKLAFAGLAPGALVAVAVIALRQAPSDVRWHALRLPARTFVAAALPIGSFMLLNVAAWHRPALGAAAGVAGYASEIGNRHGGIGGFLSFTWQLGLPRLPGATDYLAGGSPLRTHWLNGFVSVKGAWSQIGHPDWVYLIAPVPALAALALAVRSLVVERRELRRRLAEPLAYLGMSLGLLAAIGIAFYTSYLQGDPVFVQSRYLFPLAALFATVLALAARGAGRRWGPAVGALVVLVVLAHDIGTQLLMISTWYA